MHPSTDREIRPPASAVPGHRANAPVAILVVDDSEDDALLLSRLLARSFPHTLLERVECADGMQRALAARDWDLIISDHVMPRFDSLAALEVLKASGKDIPFVIYSGELPPEKGVTAMHGGAHDFVYKSSPERLLPVIERELKHSRIRRAKEQAERSVVRLVNYDELTELPNRNLFIERVQLRLRDDPHHMVRAAVCFLDLDRFMRINDSFGYAAGDALIRQVGLRLLAGMGDTDLVARVGQDKFAVFVEGVDGADAAQVLAATLMEHFGTPFRQAGQELFLTASLGVAIYPQHGEDVPALLKNAESAMFEAKKAGRNSVEIYRAEFNLGSSQRLRLENDLRQAIQRGELFLLHQPILDAAGRRILGTEALARWRHPELGLVPPDQFIPIADESGVIFDIGEWVLREACVQTRTWHDLGFKHLFAAVNFSAAQFNQHRVADRVEAVLRETGLPPAALELEITETVAMHNAQSTIETMRKLKDLGVRLSIDDFGTGYSSLAYLKRFPIDVLKIDKSFVKDVTVDDDDAAIVHAILALARSLKLHAHAEGVETAAQAAFLVEAGCNRVQGYLLGKPMPAEALLAQLRDCAPNALAALPSSIART